MRTAINGAWLYAIMLTLMVFIIAYIGISINYAHAYKMKTEIVTVIEQYSGINTNSVSKIARILDDYHYSVKIECGNYKEVFTSRNGTSTSGNEAYYSEKYVGIDYGGTVYKSQKGDNTKHSVCIYRYHFKDKYRIPKYYYMAVVTFQLNLPLVGNILSYRVSGETNAIAYPNDMYCNDEKSCHWA